MFSKGFSKYSTMASVSICDNIDISLFTKGIIIKKIRENTKNIASIVITEETASPRRNFFMWTFFNNSHNGRPSIDRMMAIAKYTNMSGKKNINNPTTRTPAMGFMKAFSLFNLQFTIYN